MSLQHIIKRIFDNSDRLSYTDKININIPETDNTEEQLPKLNSDYGAICTLHTSNYALGMRGSISYDRFNYSIEIETTGRWMLVLDEQRDVFEGKRTKGSVLFIECFVIHPFKPLGWIRENDLDIKTVFINEC